MTDVDQPQNNIPGNQTGIVDNLAQGEGKTAVGERAVIVVGNVGGPIVTGEMQGDITSID